MLAGGRERRREGGSKAQELWDANGCLLLVQRLSCEPGGQQVLLRWCVQNVDARELAGGEVKVRLKVEGVDWRLPIRIKTSLATGSTTFWL
jgi:hypothetical protein